MGSNPIQSTKVRLELTWSTVSIQPKPTERIMSKTYFKLDETTRKVVELTEDEYLLCHGQADTMVVDATENRKRSITLDTVNCSLSELLGFLSKVK